MINFEEFPEEPIEMGPIVAVGGWCAPPEHTYDIFNELPIDWKKHALEQAALKKKWKRRAKIAEAKLLLGRKK